jgi:hypothetical protein
MKSKFKSMSIIFFHIKRSVHKEFALASRTVNPHTTVTFYCDCVKMCEDFAPNFSDKRTDRCITTMHRLTFPSLPGNVCQKQHDCHPTHPTFLFLRLKIKLKGRHFDTTEVIEVESQAVLNTLTEHDFKDAFKEMAEAIGKINTRGRGLLGG